MFKLALIICTSVFALCSKNICAQEDLAETSSINIPSELITYTVNALLEKNTGAKTHNLLESIDQFSKEIEDIDTETLYTIDQSEGLELAQFCLSIYQEVLFKLKDIHLLSIQSISTLEEDLEMQDGPYVPNISNRYLLNSEFQNCLAGINEIFYKAQWHNMPVFSNDYPPHTILKTTDLYKMWDAATAAYKKAGVLTENGKEIIVDDDIITINNTIHHAENKLLFMNDLNTSSTKEKSIFSTTFVMGNTAEDKIDITLFPLTIFYLGISGISIDDQVSARNAVDAVEHALEKVEIVNNQMMNVIKQFQCLALCTEIDNALKNVLPYTYKVVQSTKEILNRAKNILNDPLSDTISESEINTWHSEYYTLVDNLSSLVHTYSSDKNAWHSEYYNTLVDTLSSLVHTSSSDKAEFEDTVHCYGCNSDIFRSGSKSAAKSLNTTDTANTSFDATADSVTLSGYVAGNVTDVKVVSGIEGESVASIKVGNQTFVGTIDYGTSEDKYASQVSMTFTSTSNPANKITLMSAESGVDLSDTNKIQKQLDAAFGISQGAPISLRSDSTALTAITETSAGAATKAGVYGLSYGYSELTKDVTYTLTDGNTNWTKSYIANTAKFTDDHNWTNACVSSDELTADRTVVFDNGLSITIAKGTDETDQAAGIEMIYVHENLAQKIYKMLSTAHSLTSTGILN